MAQYYDLFVAPVPDAKVDAFRRQTQVFASVLRDAGASSFVEIEGDDAQPGKLTSFPQSVDLKPGEKVFVGIAGYDSRAHRATRCSRRRGRTRGSPTA